MPKRRQIANDEALLLSRITFPETLLHIPGDRPLAQSRSFRRPCRETRETYRFTLTTLTLNST